MNNITFTDKAPAFHQRAMRALEADTSKSTVKKLAEMREVGRQKGWND